MTRIRLDEIVFDAGTQIRAAINESVVTDYADDMSEGATFPPVVLFHDGNKYYMADGFHRGLASKRVGYVEIDAQIQVGTKVDALWFALGANKANAHRLTDADKKHAIMLAFQTWPDRSTSQIAEQIGVNQGYAGEIRKQVNATVNLPDRVTGKDGKSYPASRTSRDERAEIVARLLKAGASPAELRAAVGSDSQLIAKVRRSLGIGTIDRSKSATEQRLEQMRQMAVDGHTTRQIASVVGQSLEACRVYMRKHGITVPADRAVGKTKRHDANRIVSQMVMDAEHLTADVGLIDFDDLDKARLPEWLGSLKESRDKLMTFIRRLMKEQQKHGQAA